MLNSLSKILYDITKCCKEIYIYMSSLVHETSPSNWTLHCIFVAENTNKGRRSPLWAPLSDGPELVVVELASRPTLPRPRRRPKSLFCISTTDSSVSSFDRVRPRGQSSLSPILLATRPNLAGSLGAKQLPGIKRKSWTWTHELSSPRPPSSSPSPRALLLLCSLTACRRRRSPSAPRAARETGRARDSWTGTPSRS